MASFPSSRGAAADISIIEGPPPNAIQQTFVPGNPPPRLRRYVPNYNLLSQQEWYINDTEMQDLLIQLVNVGFGPQVKYIANSSFFMAYLRGLYRDAYRDGLVRFPTFRASQQIRRRTPSPPIIRKIPTPSQPLLKPEDLVCCICYENQINTVLMGCGHMLCSTCAVKVRECPKCRKKIVSRHNIFFNKYLKYKQKYIKLKK